jgi:hypothetical protein
MRRFILRLLVAVSLALIPALCRAQEPLKVTPCDLVTTPEKYSGKVVEVTARVYLAFEDFSLAQPGCEDAYPGVWLVYGGDEPTPTASTVNDLSRKSGSVMKVNGMPIPLVHDDALKLFTQRLNAMRITPIDDRPCYDCYLYRVSATLTGMFFAAKKEAQSFSGYGHLGCCNLLAIEQVGDVTAERTAIPMGGTFHCDTQKKDLGATEAQQLNELHISCKGLIDKACLENRAQQMTAAASYLGDKIHADDGSFTSEGVIGKSVERKWVSADRLTTYSIALDLEEPAKNLGSVAGGVITRSTCTAVVPPLPMSAVTSCWNLWSKFPVDRDEVEKTAARVASGAEIWRTGTADHASPQALKQAARIWGITPAKDLSPDKCEDPTEYEDEQFVWCGWNDKDGMQSLNIQVTRFGYLRRGKGWSSVPWILTRGSGTVCKVEN